MKKCVLVVALIVGGLGNVLAACPGSGYLNGNAVIQLLSGKTAVSPVGCTRSGASANCSWQELHQAGGALIEQHSGTASDPAETVGSWTVATSGPNNGKVTHSYSGGGGSYTYDVSDNRNGTYSFCGGNGEFTFTLH